MADRNVNIERIIGLMQKNLECAICLELLKNPVSTKCDHQFCRFCITQFLGNKRNSPCPLCKKPITKRGLNDRPELGKIVENVQKLISAYQEDTGSIFSPPRGSDMMDFLSCTPEPLPSKAPRGTKRKSLQLDQNNDIPQSNPTRRRSKRKKDDDSGNSPGNGIVNDESTFKTDDDILLPGDNANDELLNYLETGSCGAVIAEHSVSGNHLDSASTVAKNEKIENTRRRTRSAERRLLDKNNEGDFQAKTETVLLPDEISSHLNCDIGCDQVNLGEICNETGDAKIKNRQNHSRKRGKANVRKSGNNIKISSDDLHLDEKKTLSIETHHEDENDNQNQNKSVMRNNKNTRNNRKFRGEINKNQENGKTENLQILQDENLEDDVLFDVIQMDEKKSKDKNSPKSDVLFKDIKINEKENNLYCGKLRERKSRQSMKELSDSFGEDESSGQIISQLSVSDKTSENGDFFNKKGPKMQKTYGRKDNVQPKNGARREKITDVNRVTEWINNLPESKDLGEKKSCEKVTSDVDMQLDTNAGTGINNCAVDLENESEGRSNMLPEDDDVQLNTKEEGNVNGIYSTDVDNKNGENLVCDKIGSSLKTKSGKIHMACSEVKNHSDNSCKIIDVPCADIENKNAECMFPMVPQRKRIFKCTREAGVHDHMTIKQCKGKMSFKMVNSENAHKFTKTQTQDHRNIITKEDKRELKPFVLNGEENKEVGEKMDVMVKRLSQPDTGQESDPYEFKSSQRTPVQVKNKNKKLKNKKGHKKSQLQIKFVEKSNKKSRDSSNDVEIISDDDDHDDGDGGIIDSDVDKTCEAGKSSDGKNNHEESKGDEECDPEIILQSNVIRKSKKTKKQKFQTLTQKDFDDLEKLKDKISDAEDYDLLTSTQEASEKIGKEQESENDVHVIDVIPDSEGMQNSEKLKTKKKVSFCNNVNIIKHPNDTSFQNKVEVKILKKNNSPSPASVIQETQTESQSIKHSHDADDGEMNVQNDYDKIKKSGLVLNPHNELDLKILKKNDSPSVVNVIHETQNISQGSGCESADNRSKDCAFKHPGEVEFTRSNKVLISKSEKSSRTGESGTTEIKINQTSDLDVCKDYRGNKPDDEDIDSSGTDDLDVEPGEEEFETINLDIQPKEIKERLSQDMNSQFLIKTSDNTAQYKSPIRQLPTKCEKVVLSVQETPQIQTVQTTNNVINRQSQINQSHMKSSENRLISREKFARKTKTVVKDMTESGDITTCVIEETPVVSVVKETPAVSMVKSSVSLVKETQLSSPQMSESPLPKPEDVCKVTPVSDISSVETMIDESQTLPSFVVNQMEIESSNIQETQVLGSCETGTDDTQQSISILTLPNKIYQDELLTETPSQISQHSYQLKVKTIEKSQNDQEIQDVEKETKEKNLTLNKKQKQNKLKKNTAKSPIDSGVDSAYVSVSNKKRDDFNSSDYIPATEGASRDNTPIIPIVLLENLEKNSEIVTKSLSCNFTSANTNENDITKKELIEDDGEKSRSDLPTDENVIHEKTEYLKNPTDESLNDEKIDSEEVLIKCEEIKDLGSQESIAEDIPSTLVSLQTVKKLEKSLSKNIKSSPEDIFMLDSESLTEVNCFDDGEIPQNQEGVCFMTSENSESQSSLKQSQEKKNYKNVKQEIEVELKADIDIQENTVSKKQEIPLGAGSVSASAIEIRSDDVTEMNDNVVTQITDSMGKSASENPENSCSSKFNASNQMPKDKYSDSDSENEAELKRAKVKVKTKRGLAKRMKLSAAQNENAVNVSFSSENVDCLDSKKMKTLNGENKMEVSDLENQNPDEEFIVSNSIEKVSPKFSNSPQKRFTPSKGITAKLSQNLENLQRSFTPKRTSLTFKKIPRKSGCHGNLSPEDNITDVNDKNSAVDIGVVSESQASRVEESVDTCNHDDANSEVSSESQMSRVKESFDTSYHDNISDVTGNRIINKENEIPNERNSGKQKMKKVFHESQETTDNMRSRNRNKKQKKKRVKPVESSSSEDDDFDRSSPLPDIFGNNSKSEVHKTRQTLGSSSEDEEFILTRQEDEQETVDEGEEHISSKVKHQGNKIVKQLEDNDSDVVMVSQTSTQLFSDEEDMNGDVISGGSKSPIKDDNESEDSETEVVVRNPKGKSRSIITDDSSSDDESFQDSSQQMNMTSSSAFSSQSEAMTTQKKEDLEKDLERMRKQILDLEAQLSATKQTSSTSKQDRMKKSQNSDSSMEGGSLRKKSKRKRLAVRRLSSSDSSNDDDGNAKGDVRVVSEIGEDGEAKADTEIHQYPSSGDETDELFLTPLPPSPPPLTSEVPLALHTDLPAQVKESDEFLKKVLNRDPSSTSELSSPILSQPQFPSYEFQDQEALKNRKNKKKNGEILNSENDKDFEGPRHSSPYLTKMDLKITQHSTPLGKDKNNSKVKESPMFAQSQRSKDTFTRTVLSPLVNNGEIKKEGMVKHKCFVASSLQLEHLKEIQKLAVMNNCKFQTKFSPSVTHVIVSTKPFGSRVCDRTLKFFQGLANKCWIMDYQWVIDSRKAGHLLPEDNYEIKGDTVTTDNHNGPRRVRLSRKPLFENFQICIISSSDGLTPDNLRELFTTCHGEVVPDVKDFSADTTNFIVTCTDYDEENPTEQEIKTFNRYYRQCRVLTITREWVLDSLTLNTVQPLHDYVLTCVKGMTVPDLR